MRNSFLSLNVANQLLSVSTRQRIISDDLILFVHGLGCTKESFHKAFESPKLCNYSICSFDLIGFGASDKPKDFSYDLHLQADLLVKVARKLDVNRLHIVGHSMGGAIGILATKQLPNLVSFVNVEGNLISEDAGLVSRQVAEQTEKKFLESGFDKFIESLQKTNESDLLSWAEWSLQSDPQAFYRSACSLVKWSDSGRLFPLFQSINKKAYIHGDKSSYQHLEQYLSNTKRYSISGSGHFMMVNNAEGFYNCISQWLDQVVVSE